MISLYAVTEAFAEALPVGATVLMNGHSAIVRHAPFVDSQTFGPYDFVVDQVLDVEGSLFQVLASYRTYEVEQGRRAEVTPSFRVCLRRMPKTANGQYETLRAWEAPAALVADDDTVRAMVAACATEALSILGTLD